MLLSQLYLEDFTRPADKLEIDQRDRPNSLMFTDPVSFGEFTGPLGSKIVYFLRPNYEGASDATEIAQYLKQNTGSPDVRRIIDNAVTRFAKQYPHDTRWSYIRRALRHSILLSQGN